MELNLKFIQHFNIIWFQSCSRKHRVLFVDLLSQPCESPPLYDIPSRFVMVVFRNRLSYVSSITSQVSENTVKSITAKQHTTRLESIINHPSRSKNCAEGGSHRRKSIITMQNTQINAKFIARSNDHRVTLATTQLSKQGATKIRRRLKEN